MKKLLVLAALAALPSPALAQERLPPQTPVLRGYVSPLQFERQGVARYYWIERKDGSRTRVTLPDDWRPGDVIPELKRGDRKKEFGPRRTPSAST